VSNVDPHIRQLAEHLLDQACNERFSGWEIADIAKRVLRDETKETRAAVVAFIDDDEPTPSQPEPSK
jgi:hypothetical protein